MARAHAHADENLARLRRGSRNGLAGSAAAHALLGLLAWRFGRVVRAELRIDPQNSVQVELLFGAGAGGLGASSGAGASGGGAEQASVELVRAAPSAGSGPSSAPEEPAPSRGARVIDRSAPVEPRRPEAGSAVSSAAPSSEPDAESAQPFLLGRPGARAGRTLRSGRGEPGALSAGEVFARTQQQGVGALGSEGTGAGGEGGGGAGAGGSGAALTGEVREQLAAAAPRHVPGAVAYFRRALEQMRTAWRPRVRREPSLVDAAVGTFFTSPETYALIQGRALGPTNPDGNGGGYAAAQALDFAHPHSPTPAPMLTMSARAAATERVSTVELDVEQDGGGRVRAVRVVRRSGVSGFDRVAEEAVRESIAHTAAPEQGMGRGWRSRWLCQVIADRSPLLTGVPGVGGSPANFALTVEAEMDPNPGEARQVRYPGSLHVRSRVRVLRSEELR